MASPVPVNTDPFPKSEPRPAMVGGAVSEREKGDILSALAQAGFPNMSAGVRGVCIAFVKSPEIREAVDRLKKAGELE